MSQAPTEAFRVEMSAPVLPPPTHTEGPGSYDGGFNDEPPHKDNKNRKKIAAIALGGVIALGTFIGVGYGMTSGDKTPSSSSQEDSTQAGGETDRVLFGAECKNHPDVYREGRMFITDGYGNVVADKMDNIGDNITIMDGPDGEHMAPVITDYPAKIKDQIKESVDLLIEDDLTKVPSYVYLYGNPPQDSNNFDGMINDNLKACVTN